MAITTIIKDVLPQKNGRAKLIAIFQGGPDGDRVAEVDVDAYATPEEADAALRAARGRQAERVPLAKTLAQGERDIDASTPDGGLSDEDKAKLAYVGARSRARTSLQGAADGIVDQADADALVQAAKELYKSAYAGL